ncbi:MAG: DUF6152 family protein [Steroidobacteraceae bacterium]
MRVFLATLAVFSCGLLIVARADAHHSFAMFDADKKTTLTGEVIQVSWTNPHIWVYLQVVDDKTKKPVTWAFEAAGPRVMEGQGWKRNSLKQGDKATVVFHPLRSGKTGGSLLEASVNGKVIGK